MGHSWSCASLHPGTDSERHKRNTGLPPIFGCRHSKSWASGSVPCGLDVGGYRHCIKSLQSEPCKKDQCWESTAPALGTNGRHLGWHPSYSMSPATCGISKVGQTIPVCPGDSQIAMTRVAHKSRPTAWPVLFCPASHMEAGVALAGLRAHRGLPGCWAWQLPAR